MNHTCVVPFVSKQQRLWGGVTGKCVIHALSIGIISYAVNFFLDKMKIRMYTGVVTRREYIHPRGYPNGLRF